MFSLPLTIPWLRLAGAGLIALALYAAATWLRHEGVVDGRAEVQQQWDQERAQRAEQAVARIQAARAEDTRRAAAFEKVATDAQAKINRARDAAATADRAAGQLRDQLAAFVHGYRCTPAEDPGAAAPSQAASDPLGVLADLQRRADERAGVLARYADAAREAGAACERAHDALTAPGP